MTKQKEKRKAHQTPRKALHHKANLYLLFCLHFTTSLNAKILQLAEKLQTNMSLNKKMCFLIACWEQLPSKAQVSPFIASHSLTTDRIATHYIMWTHIQCFLTNRIATLYTLWTHIQCFLTDQIATHYIVCTHIQ